MKVIFRRDKIILILIVLGMTLMAAIDIYEDLSMKEPLFQVFTEALLFAFAIYGISSLLSRNFLLKTQIKDVRTELGLSSKDAKKWFDQHQNLLKGLGYVIDTQLTQWGLSVSEKEISLFLLKGLSFKEIADIRGTNEKTVRQQSLKVYEKSGLSGRSELSAFFLEDVLSPIEDYSGSTNTEKNRTSL